MNIKVATSQFSTIKGDFDANLNKAINIIEKASKQQVDILLLQELFQDNYFCSTKNDKFDSSLFFFEFIKDLFKSTI